MKHRHHKKGRAVNGIVLLDKPLGISSNDALQKVKRLFNARKAGHTGSLDKLASGLLPLCLGEATKISSFLLNADKRYRATVRLGERTTTGDAEGEVLETKPVPALDMAQLEQVLDRFRGTIVQVPPMFSAIKQNGQPLYKLAHQGIEVERKSREVTIHSLQIVSFDSPDLDIEVHSSKGTYIRTLAEDIGAALGCGGYISYLRRVGAGPYTESDMLTMEELESLAAQGNGALDAVLRPLETALMSWPDVRLPSDMAYYVKQGQPVMVPHAPTRGWVRLYAGDKGFMGVGEVLDDGRIAPRRLLVGGA